MTFGSLFSGGGGLDLGLERAGLQCVWQVENDPFCQRVLKHRFPRVGKRHDDVHTFPPAGDWFCDIIVGGDPCQENSNARQSTGCEQPSLGAEYIRILDAIRPPRFLRENPSAVRPDAPWPWWRFRAAAESLGYVVLPFRLRSCCVGADHRRDRLFLLGELPNAVQTRLQGNVIQELERTGGGEGIRNTPRQNRRDASPRVCRAVDGIPNWVDRLRVCGNAVDVHVAETIGRWIIESAC